MNLDSSKNIICVRNSLSILVSKRDQIEVSLKLMKKTLACIIEVHFSGLRVEREKEKWDEDEKSGHRTT